MISKAEERWLEEISREGQLNLLIYVRMARLHNTLEQFMGYLDEGRGTGLDPDWSEQRATYITAYPAFRELPYKLAALRDLLEYAELLPPHDSPEEEAMDQRLEELQAEDHSWTWRI